MCAGSVWGNLNGRVVGISDRATLTVLVDRREVKVRLADIDAPETKQAFGTGSKQALSELCFQRDARLESQVLTEYRPRSSYVALARCSRW